MPLLGGVGVSVMVDIGLMLSVFQILLGNFNQSETLYKVLIISANVYRGRSPPLTPVPPSLLLTLISIREHSHMTSDV